MIIAGIDPGTARTGYGIIEKKGNTIIHINHGLIETKAGTLGPERLKIIHAGVKKVIKKYNVDTAAVEKLFFNTNAKTALSVGEARGVILLAAVFLNVDIYEYTPLQVKMALTGHGQADKDQVGQMVKTLLCLKEVPKPDDVADALAIAICCSSSIKMQNIKQ